MGSLTRKLLSGLAKSFSSSTPRLAMTQGVQPTAIEPKLYTCGSKGTRLLCLESATAWRIHGVNEAHVRASRSQPQCQETVQDWIKEIRKVVETDLRKPPGQRIDSVVWAVEDLTEPTSEMWQSLDGLSPKHLQMRAGYEEELCLEGLGALQNPWTELETLRLCNIVESSVVENAPQCLSRIHSLSLEYCCAENLVPPNATNLKHLQIIENNACDMFINAVEYERNPGLAQQLEVLDIQTTNGCDMSHQYEPQDFRDRLKKCTNLREFHYAACIWDGLDTMIAAYIPRSVETLKLRFTRSLPFLRAFDDWIKHAADPDWLPNLETFEMTIDSDSEVSDLKVEDDWSIPVDSSYPAATFDRDFAAKKRELYETLKSKKPSLDLQ